jgi:very-short-patch-repair endonuclease
MQNMTEKQKKALLRKIESQKKKFENKEEGKDFVKCHFCGMMAADLTNHVKIHGISAAEYTKQFPLRSQTYLEDQSKRISGTLNPAYQHGGKYSPFSENYFKKDHNIQESKDKAKKNRQENNGDNTKIEYWLQKTNGDLEEAKRLLSLRQSTFSLKKCIDKYGEEKGTEVWSKRQERWMKSFKKQNYSKISQVLFKSIMETYQSEEVYFAEWERSDMKDYKNKEYRLKLNSGKTILPDFIDLQRKKIIEFDGTYWHSISKTTPQKEIERQIMLEQSGFSLMRIKEKDFKQNPQEIVKMCLEFLTQ